MPNALATESSLYLRQHADNPVDWLPWSDAALGRARSQDKPILLSIGYASCHWCHVMAHESFEDAEIASVMNRLYLCIKVDREERPDIDRVYQLAHQALTRRGGGWPLTVFLDPVDLTPFLAGTYFPRVARHGLPSFIDVLRGAEAWWREHRADARSQGEALARFLQELDGPPAARSVPSPKPVDDALRRLDSAFDREHGGFFGAPKFPQHGALELMLRCQADSNALERSLEAMAAGGLNDHLGGGFFRYCVDVDWQIPHFEKMLYDNAQLLPLYAEAAVRLSRKDLADVARAVFLFLERDMRLDHGAYASALDADTHGEEGASYVWERDAFAAVLDPEDTSLMVARYGLDRPANFEGRAWHLTAARTLEAVADAAGLTREAAVDRIESARQTLLAARRQRPQPQRDDKFLTAWNALAVTGLARAGRLLGDAPMIDAGTRILEAIRRECFLGDRLFVTAARAQQAFLDDHAYLLAALIEMLATRFRAADLSLAMRMADALLERFEDQAGGFFLSAHDQEPLFHRPKPFMDESLPSGNGVAACALLRLGHLLGETRYLDAAARTLVAADDILQRQPHACATLLLALREYHQPATQIVARVRDDTDPAWRAALEAAGRIGPLYRLADTEPLPGILGQVAEGSVIVCRGTQCSAPLSTPQALLQAIG